MEIKIFEIPIYNYSIDEFENKLKQHKSKSQKTYEKEYLTCEKFEQIYALQSNGKLNYLDYRIGQMEIYYYNGFVRYIARVMMSKKYLSKKAIAEHLKPYKDKDLSTFILEDNKIRSSYSLSLYKMPLFTEKKHYTTKYEIGGIHSDIRNKSNEQIIETIINDLKTIKNDSLFKSSFFDTESFLKIVKHLDVKSYIHSLSVR